MNGFGNFQKYQILTIYRLSTTDGPGFDRLVAVVTLELLKISKNFQDFRRFYRN